MKLYSLNDIFERRLLRIPDYQRGYAWKKHQINDFWEDISQLDINKIHYTGVVTLEPVPKNIWSQWAEDEWIIDGVGFKPFYVVDGQQRLTTSMMLIQAIIECIDLHNKSLPEEERVTLNYQSIVSIR